MGQIFAAFSENLNFDRTSYSLSKPSTKWSHFLTHKSLDFYDIISKKPQMIHRLNPCTFFTRIYHQIDRAKDQKTRNPTIFNIIRCLAGSMGQNQASDALSIILFFQFPLDLGTYFCKIKKGNKKINWNDFCKEFCKKL